MKAKVILASTAVLGLLTACSQDELGVIENNAPAKATTAPVAGKAVIKVASDGTRFNDEFGYFEKGDKIGLYQMDNYNREYDGKKIISNANNPENYWKNQTIWWNLHQFVDNINTNYKYVMNEDGEFVNPGAELVEGNYFLLFDPETMANSAGHKPYANRRDLWKAIKKQVVLNNYTNTNYNKDGFGGLYGTLDNQFYLDYQQIYRNSETLNEDGELVIEAQLKPVLGKYTVDLVNESHTAYRFKEIRIYPTGDGFVPNIAYVRPRATEFNGVLQEKYPSTYPNGKKTFTVEMARHIVVYDDVTEGYVPYGYEGDKNVAAYYSIKFEEPAVIEAHEGSATLAQALEAIFVAPIWPDFEQSSIVVYADKYDVLAENADGSRGEWVPGYFYNDKNLPSFMQIDNKRWTVERTFDEVNKGRLYFDDNYFHTFAATDGVMSTTDLYDQVEAVLKSGYVEKIEARVVGKGIEINNKLNDLINSYEKKYGKEIVLSVIPETGDDITLVDENMLNDNFDLQYPSAGDAAIIIAADQKLEANWTGKKFVVKGDVKIDLNGKEMDNVAVSGKVALPSSGIINGIVTGAMTVEEDATVQVGNKGLTNKDTGTITVEGALQEKTTGAEGPFVNDGTVVVAETGEVTITSGSGKLDVSAVKEVEGGKQNHIEAVNGSEMTVIDSNVTYGDYMDIQNRLKTILAEHNLKGDQAFKEVAVTSSADALTCTADSINKVASWAQIVSLKMANDLKSADGYLGQLKKITLAKTAVVLSKKTLKARDLEIDGKLDVRTSATVNVTEKVELNADIKLYENAKLKGTPTVAANGGKVYGYDDQIDWVLSDDVKQGNE